jgi:hypothetical protein
MKKVFCLLFVMVVSFLMTTSSYAVPSSPTITYSTSDVNVTVQWDTSSGATGYILSYATYPFTGQISTLDVQNQTSFSIDLWDGASFYIAVQSYDEEGTSGYSNVGHFTTSSNTNPFSSGSTYGADASLVSSDVSFSKYFSNQYEVEIASIGLSLTAESSKYKFVNVIADLNKDGLFVPFVSGTNTQNEWLVQNMPLAVASQGSTFLVDVYDSFTAGTSLNVRTILTESPLGTAVQWTGAIPSDAAGRDVIVSTKSTEWVVTSTPDETSIGSGGGKFVPLALDAANSTDAADSSPIPGTLYREGMPDGNQGPNQCVAQSIANNISWLARKYNFTDKLDKAYKEDDGYPDDEKDYSTTTGASVLGSIVNESFEALGTYNPQVGITVPGATSFAEAIEGLKTKILEGKNKFVNDLGLPIESSIIDVPSSSTIFDEIKSAMDSGCAVELVMEVTKSNGRSAGHAVSVAGYADIDINGSSYKGLTFHNGDSINESTNELSGNDTHEITNSNGQDTINGVPMLDGNTVKRLTAKPSFAVKQCYKEPETPTEVGCATFTGDKTLYAISFTDPANHKPFTGDPFPGTSPHNISYSNNIFVVTGPSPFVPVSGSLVSSDGNTCTFLGTGSGTVAGFNDVSVTMNGTLGPDGLSGTFVMGSGGELYGTPMSVDFATAP